MLDYQALYETATQEVSMLQWLLTVAATLLIIQSVIFIWKYCLMVRRTDIVEVKPFSPLPGSDSGSIVPKPRVGPDWARGCEDCRETGVEGPDSRGEETICRNCAERWVREQRLDDNDDFFPPIEHVAPGSIRPRIRRF